MALATPLRPAGQRTLLLTGFTGDTCLMVQTASSQRIGKDSMKWWPPAACTSPGRLCTPLIAR
jgi:hypothetical protein